jgi:hypothetical protein
MNNKPMARGMTGKPRENWTPARLLPAADVKTATGCPSVRHHA